MALLFMDSFDHYALGDILEKWTSRNNVNIVAGAGRRGTSAIRLAYSDHIAIKTVPATGTTAIMGFSLKTASASTNRLFGIWSPTASRDLVIIQLNSDGTFTAFKGLTYNSGVNNGVGAALGTSASVWNFGTANYLEFKIVIHSSTGTVELKMNGTTVLNLTGVDTANGSGTNWSTAWLGGLNGVNCDYDDLYLLDGSGAAPWNNFLGDVRVDVRLPTAPGATTGWTPSTGANWQNVDDTAPNDDTDYNTAPTVGLTDTFTVQDAPVVGASIFGIQHCISAKKADAGAGSVAPVIRHSGVDNVGSNSSLGTDYNYLITIHQVNPGTSAQWTEAGFNAAEFGYKRTV